MSERAGILIVEDRSIVAAKVRRELERGGFTIAGMAATPAAASAFVDRVALLGAVLDIDLRGEPVYPVAQLLRQRRVPFLFLTGYSHTALPEPWGDVPLVEKPFEADTLVRALRAAIAGVMADPPPKRVTTPAIRRAWDRVRHTRDILTEQRAWSEDHRLSRDLD